MGYLYGDYNKLPTLNFENKLAIAIVGAIVLAVIITVCYLCIPTKKDTVITNVHWTYTANLKQKTKMHGEEWGRPYGKDIITIRCESRYYGQEECMCSTDEDGNRHCLSCAEYRDWCMYDYWDWPIIRTEVSGGDTHKTYWPVLNAEGPNQRVEHIEDYTITFQDNKKEKEWTHKPSNLNDFNLYNKGEAWQINAYTLGSATPLKRLTAEQ